MGIKYSISQIRNPQKPEEPKKFYAKAQVREKVGLERIASEIAYATSLTEGDVLNVLTSLTKQATNHLADGDMVELGDLGTLQYQLSSNGADTKEEFNHSYIKGARLQFRPGAAFRRLKLLLKYERVLSVKAIREAKKNS